MTETDLEQLRAIAEKAKKESPTRRKASLPSGNSAGEPVADVPPIQTDSPTAPKRQRQRSDVPVVLQLMKIATLLWVIGMPAIATWSYIGAVRSVRGYVNGGYTVMTTGNYGTLEFTPKSRYYAAAKLRAVFAGVTIPTMVYLPIMIVLFVFWFIERQTQRATE